MFILDLNVKIKSEDLHSPSVYSPLQLMKSSSDLCLNITAFADFKVRLNCLSCFIAGQDAEDLLNFTDLLKIPQYFVALRKPLC